MPLNSRRENFLDGEEIATLWVEMGTLSKVYRFFLTEGRVNPSSNRPYSKNSLWRSAAIFIVEQPDKARVLFAREGSVFSDEEWELYILHRAMQVYKSMRSTFLRWVIQHDWARKYESVYRDEYAVKPDDYDFFLQSSRRMPRGEGRMAEKPLGRPRKAKNSADLPE